MRIHKETAGTQFFLDCIWSAHCTYWIGSLNDVEGIKESFFRTRTSDAPTSSQTLLSKKSFYAYSREIKWNIFHPSLSFTRGPAGLQRYGKFNSTYSSEKFILLLLKLTKKSISIKIHRACVWVRKYCRLSRDRLMSDIVQSYRRFFFCKFVKRTNKVLSIFKYKSMHLNKEPPRLETN